MTAIFLVCAIIGGTVLFCQLVMTLLGLAGHDTDFDTSGGGDGFGGDFHGDVSHGGASDMHHDATSDNAEHPEDHGHVSSSWLFNVISFRTVVAALTFFGLTGLTAQSAGASTPMVLIIAIGAGVGAMYAVYWMMQALYRLRTEGTVRIDRAVGRQGTVYLVIPSHNSGAGKIHLNLQNRIMEYRAITSGEAIPTGAKIVVVNVVGADTLEVQPVLESERIEHV